MLEHQKEHVSQWASIGSISCKIGCTSERRRRWVRQAERDQGLRAGPMTSDLERLKQLERENRELRQANEIPRKASGYLGLSTRTPFESKEHRYFARNSDIARCSIATDCR